MAKLFHYHWWTDKVEEMETFYEGIGFRTVLRVGRYQGEMQAFNPPLSWNDFREKDIQFRIIEMRRGKANLTFGQGKRNQFDHIGFLVGEDEHDAIVQRALDLNWKVNVGDRRTFIGTPWRLRIELQKRKDIISNEDNLSIKSMEIMLPLNHDPNQIATLLNLRAKEDTPEKVVLTSEEWELIFKKDLRLSLKILQFETVSRDGCYIKDPLGTALIFKNRYNDVIKN